MANTYRRNTAQQDSSKSETGGYTLFGLIATLFRFNRIFDNGVPTRFIPYIVWTTTLILLYIANAHYTEKTIRSIDKLKFEVEELRTEFTTIQSSYMVESKQSKVAERVKHLGLVESKNPPIKLKIKE
jgi:hypothetical protein